MRAGRPKLLLIATVDAMHAEYVVKALDRGIDVITEKPIGYNEKQCRAVLDAEKRGGARSLSWPSISESGDCAGK